MKKYFFLLIFVFFVPVVYAGAYGAGSFGGGNFGVGQSSSGSSSTKSSSDSSVGVGGGAPLENSARINQGVTLQVRSSKRITINSKEHFDNPERAKFPFSLSDNSQHHILVDSVDSQKKSAVITLSSTPITVEFGVDSAKKFDLNNNGLYDTEISLEKIFDNNKAVTVKITAFEETQNIVSKQSNQKINSPLPVQNKQDKIIQNKTSEEVIVENETQNVSEVVKEESTITNQKQESWNYKIKYYFNVIIKSISKLWNKITSIF